MLQTPETVPTTGVIDTEIVPTSGVIDTEIVLTTVVTNTEIVLTTVVTDTEIVLTTVITDTKIVSNTGVIDPDHVENVTLAVRLALYLVHHDPGAPSLISPTHTAPVEYDFRCSKLSHLTPHRSPPSASQL